MTTEYGAVIQFLTLVQDNIDYLINEQLQSEKFQLHNALDHKQFFLHVVWPISDCFITIHTGMC